MNRTLFILLIALPIFLTAQKEDNVIVMGYCGKSELPEFGISIMDFNEHPVHIYKQSDTLDFNMAHTNASISDKDGNLLLYTNGTTIMGANHDTIVNGAGLYLGTRDDYRESGSRTPQAALFLTSAKNNSVIYLFHLYRQLEINLPIPELLYSKIEFTDKYPYGIVTKKNTTIINTFLRPTINAVRHANGKDWWLIIGEEFESKNIIIKFDGTDEFMIGNYQSPFLVTQGTGTGAFTPDGSKFIRVNSISETEGYYLEIFDFDRCTGMLSNPRMENIRNLDFAEVAIGTVVSPNSRYLYLTSNLYIIQYDLSREDIFSHPDTVATFNGYADPIQPILKCYFRQGFLAPDGKIYILSGNTCRVMTIIHEPNKKGMACNVEQQALEMPTRYNRSLPNFPNYRLGPLVGSDCYPVPDSRELIAEVFPNPVSDELVVSLEENAGIKVRLDLYNYVGQQVFSSTLSGGKEYHYLRMPDLVSGMYVYRLVSGNERVKSGKLVVE